MGGFSTTKYKYTSYLNQLTDLGSVTQQAYIQICLLSKGFDYYSRDEERILSVGVIVV